jgi:hypothetical protein
MAMTPVALIRPQLCTCGHDHRTHRDEHVEACLECRCSEYIRACQNCGAEASPTTIIGLTPALDVCSRRCALQLEYALASPRKRKRDTP